MKLYIAIDSQSKRGVVSESLADINYIKTGNVTGFGVETQCSNMREEIEDGCICAADVVIREIDIEL